MDLQLRYRFTFIELCLANIPESPSTQYSRTLVPNAIPSTVFGTRVPKYWALGPSGYGSRGGPPKAGRCLNPAASKRLS